jgi:hypothetical protein
MQKVRSSGRTRTVHVSQMRRLWRCRQNALQFCEQAVATLRETCMWGMLAGDPIAKQH